MQSECNATLVQRVTWHDRNLRSVNDITSRLITCNIKCGTSFSRNIIDFIGSDQFIQIHQ